MSLPGSIINADINSSNIDADDKSAASAPPTTDLTENQRSKVNIESFLMKSRPNGDSESLTITLEPNEENSDFTEVNDKLEYIVQKNELVQLVNQQSNDHTTSDLVTEINNDKDDVVRKVATPTINFFKPTVKIDEEAVQVKSPEKNGDYDKLTGIISSKDKEIKKLSNRLEELEKKMNKSHKSSSSHSSSSSSSSSEKKEKGKDKKTKKKKGDLKKKMKEKQETKPKTSPKEETKEDSEENHKTKASKEKQVNVGEYRKKIDDLEEEVRKLQQANVESILSLQTMHEKIPEKTQAASNESLLNQLIVDHNLLKQELEQLKWQQSNMTQPALLVDEIAQLKRDISHLKKQNETLKQYSLQKPSLFSMHPSKSTEKIPSVYGTRSFDPLDSNYIYATQPSTTIHNKSSDYIMEHLQSVKRRPASTTPNVPNMLKTNIDSMESPYYKTRQTLQNPHFDTNSDSNSTVLVEDTTPKLWYGDNMHHRHNRYFDNNSSNDFRDNRNKPAIVSSRSVDSYVTVTTEAVSSETEEDEIGRNNYYQSPHQWKVSTKRYANTEIKNFHSNGDLLSTALDSDSTMEYIDEEEADRQRRKFHNNSHKISPRSGDRHNNKLPPATGQAFTPKSSNELRLDDTVKFARPGGKMSVGKVCFIGNLPGRSEICVGLELDEDAGKHDGIFEGRRYFQCRKNRGVFISFHKIILAYKAF